MTWGIIFLIVGAAAVGYVLVARGKKAKSAEVTYVCHVCGERDCVCHKEEADESEVG